MYLTYALCARGAGRREIVRFAIAFAVLESAFEMLRGHARRTNQKLIDVAEAIILSRRLLPGAQEAEAGADPHEDRRDR